MVTNNAPTLFPMRIQIMTLHQHKQHSVAHELPSRFPQNQVKYTLDPLVLKIYYLQYCALLKTVTPTFRMNDDVISDEAPCITQYCFLLTFVRQKCVFVPTYNI